MREMFLPYFFVMFLCGIGLGADRSGLTSGSPIIEGLVGSCVGHGGLQFLAGPGDGYEAALEYHQQKSLDPSITRTSPVSTIQ